MQAYENKLPQGFYDKKSSSVVALATTRTRINLRATTTVDTEDISNRTLGIIGSGYFFSHKLAPIPTLLVLDDGSMRTASSKSKLKKYFQVEKSSRTVERPDFIVIDGCVILWTSNWPIAGTLLDLVNAVAAFVHRRLMNNDVQLQHKRVHPWSKSIRYC